MISEASVGRAELMGGSETRPTWKKRIGNTEAKKTSAEPVLRDRIVVKTTVTASRGHRRSLTQSADNPDRKV